jgi:hypothetical protein
MVRESEALQAGRPSGFLGGDEVETANIWRRSTPGRGFGERPERDRTPWPCDACTPLTDHGLVPDIQVAILLLHRVDKGGDRVTELEVRRANGEFGLGGGVS